MYSVCPYVVGIKFAEEIAAIQDNCLLCSCRSGQRGGEAGKRRGRQN